MTTQDHEVIDKHGKRVHRNNVLEDGDRLVVRMLMMDAADPRLVAAAALADAVKRNEQFDARGHRPGYATQDTGDAGVTAREARDALVRDAWKKPAPVLEDKGTQPTAPLPATASNAQLFAARDQVVAERDRRIENAWKN